MKLAMNILLMLLLIGSHNVCRADNGDSTADINKTEDWTMAYLMEHPDVLYKIEELIDIIKTKGVDKQSMEYFKDKPPGVRSYVSKIILLHNAATYYELITNNNQEWLCNSLIENSPTDDLYYPVFTHLQTDENMGAILDYCITKNKAEKWSSFLSFIEPRVNYTAKPVLDKIKEIVAKRKAP